MMNRVSKIACAVTFIALFSRCDIFQPNQLTARTAMVGTLISTPPLEIKLAAVAGFDASFPDFDAGGFDGSFPFDAGAFADAGFMVPAQTEVFMFIGQLQGTGLDLDPVGLSGATANLVHVGGATTPLSDKAKGSYGFTSTDGGEIYVSGGDYEFQATTGGKTYIGQVLKVPAQERSPELHPAEGFITHRFGTPFTFTRPEPPSGTDRNIAFTLVYPVTSKGKGIPTYSNLPSTPLDFLKLVVAPGDWKAGTITLPATAFPLPNTNYAIIVEAVKTGGPKSDNLFSGSALLAGSADVGIVKCVP